MNWTMRPALCVATGPQTSLVLEWELELEYCCCSSSLHRSSPFLFLVSNWYIFLNIAAGRKYSSLTWPPSSGHRGTMQFWLVEYVAWVVLVQTKPGFNFIWNIGNLREIQKFGKPHSELYWIILSNKSYFGGLGGGNENKAFRDLKGSKDNDSHFKYETDCSLAQSFSLLSI